MSYEAVIYDKEDGIAVITLNRPQQLNAINEQLIREVNMVLDEIEYDNDVLAVILTGGEKIFCAGADLKEPRAPGRSQRSNRLFNRIERFGKPIIAAINGYALGGGLEIALCCDLRVASETASIGAPEVKVGTIPSGGATFRLTRLIGIGRAKELLYTGNPVNGIEALNIGLVNKVSPPDMALDEAKNLAKVLLERPPLSVKAIKNCVHAAIQLDTESAVAFVINSTDLLRGTEDYQEGRTAFREKRKPVWRGK